ncbi:MAG: chemotaxis protein CheW [Magnetococcales bacterium]|nr:chemotaxis protein CheW [Magnetococcales bacterium]
MGELFPSDIDYLVFTVDRKRYGIPYLNVVSIVDMPSNQTVIPSSPHEMRGVVCFRDESLSVIDLRLCFGATSRGQETEELISNMALRKQDHINWLGNLKKSVFNHEPITVQTNPHKCAFGMWYDNFQSDNANLKAYMARFDKPHQQIHHLAVDAERLIKSGQEEAAKQLIQSAEQDVLQKLLSLFEGIEHVVRAYLLEYIVIVQIEGQQFGLSVDDINVFSRLESIQHPLPSSMGGDSSVQNLVQGIGRYKNDVEDRMDDVLLLDVSRIVNQCDIAA